MAPTPTSSPISSSSPATTSIALSAHPSANSYSRSATIGIGAGVGASISIFLILCFLFIQTYLRRYRYRSPQRPTYQKPLPKHSFTSSTSSSSTRSILFPNTTPTTSFDTPRCQTSHRRTPSLTHSFHEPPPVQPALPAPTALPPVAESPIIGSARPHPLPLRTFPKTSYITNTNPDPDTDPTPPQQDWTTFFSPMQHPPPIRHEVKLYRSRSTRISTLSAIVEAPVTPTATIAATLRARAKTENDALEAGYEILQGKGNGNEEVHQRSKSAE